MVVKKRPLAGQAPVLVAVRLWNWHWDRSRGAALATRNLPDFDRTGIELIDPWSATGT
jgi:hypothetical protein